MTQIIKRCKWISNITDEIYLKYHDTEWGKPQRDELKLFEGIILEGQSCGLSWLTILKKREEYRKAFFSFEDPAKISKMTSSDIDKLMMEDSGLIRYRMKLNSIIDNANAYQKMKESKESFSNFIWSFVNHKPIVNNHTTERITKSKESDEMAKELKKKGFKFIGTTTCYAFMQAYGLVNDHCNDCSFNPNPSSTTTTTKLTSKIKKTVILSEQQIKLTSKSKKLKESLVKPKSKSSKN